MPAPNREFLLQLISDARIKGPQLEETVARVLDASYWRELVPDFHIGDSGSSLECAPLNSDLIDAAALAERQDGYFRLPGVIAPAGVQRLNHAIDAVVSAGWPAAFVFMYDEAWQSARSPAASRVLEAVLGRGFRQICHVWAHVVKPVVGSTGWHPHVDGDPGRRMTVWIGLTAATLDNGCMHVVPRDATLSSSDLIPRFRVSDSQFSRTEVASLLHATHALVASPGDALGWGFDVIHWGGFARRAGEERRGLSFEYIAADQQPGDNDGPLVDMGVLPLFEDRLRFVASGVLVYRKFEPIVDRFADVARAIKTRLEPPG